MALLTPGEYGLVKKKNNSNIVYERKSMLFVKLTDSAQRALVNYLRNQDKCDAPIIEFNKDEGRILIATAASAADSDKCVAQFRFNVISNVAMEGTQGRFESIQHKRGQKQLLRFGQLTQRLRIHANEDVYEITKNRMAAIDAEQKKNCTVQLEADWNSSAPSINRRGGHRAISAAANNNNYSNSNNLSNSGVAARSNPFSQQQSEMTNVIRNKTRPITSTLAQKLSNVSSSSAAAIMRKPLKERIVHLLAVRPYKKLELIDALKRDGVRECDKPHLSDALLSVSTIRDNTYHLAKYAWNEVQESWPFYGEQERQQIKRNKSRNLTSPYSSDSGISVCSNQSPNSAAADKSPSQNNAASYKRPGYFNGVDGLQTKRQRISHYARPTPTPSSFSSLSSSRTSTPPSVAAAASALNEENNVRLPSSVEESPPSLPFHKVNSSALSPPQPQPHPKPAPIKYEQPETLKSEPPEAEYHHFKTEPGGGGEGGGDFHHYKSESSSGDYHSQSFEILPSVIVTSPIDVKLPFSLAPMKPLSSNGTAISTLANDSGSLSVPPPETKTMKPKYMKEYVTITNPVQRRKYKTDFEKIFKEYLHVHQKVDSVTNQFARLGESLKQCKKGTPDYKRIEVKIIKKYEEIKCNQFAAAKLRFEYLHEKLSHIKNLVNAYDEKMWK